MGRGQDSGGQCPPYREAILVVTNHPVMFVLLNLVSDMAIKVLIPTPLQKFTNNEATIECTGGNIVELMDTLDSNYPGIKARLCDDSGELRRFVNFYVNSEDIRFLDGKETALNDGDEVSIVPAVAGG